MFLNLWTFSYFRKKKIIFISRKKEKGSCNNRWRFLVVNYFHKVFHLRCLQKYSILDRSLLLVVWHWLVWMKITQELELHAQELVMALWWVFLGTGYIGLLPSETASLTRCLWLRDSSFNPKTIGSLLTKLCP